MDKGQERTTGILALLDVSYLPHVKHASMVNQKGTDMYLKEVYINKEAWDDINRHAFESRSLEVGGFLLGFSGLLGESPVAWIIKSVRGDCRSSSAHVVIETSTFDKILDEIETGELSIVGWYHTHPGWGIFLSGTDRNTIFQHFKDPQSIALVLDPKGGDHGFFGWDYDKMSLGRLNAYIFSGIDYNHYLEKQPY